MLVGIGELRERDDALALESDVDQHFLVVDGEHRAAHDLALADGAQRLLVLAEHLGPHFEREVVLFVGVERHAGSVEGARGGSFRTGGEGVGQSCPAWDE